jgi:hypothetical protein
MLELAESSSNKTHIQKEYDDMQFQFQQLQEELNLTADADVWNFFFLFFFSSFRLFLTG